MRKSLLLAFSLVTAYGSLLASAPAVETGTGTSVVQSIVVQQSVTLGGAARTNWPTDGGGEWATQPATTNVDAGGFSVENVRYLGFGTVTSDAPAVPSMYVKKSYVQTNQSDAETVVLLRFDGTNGATTFVDSSRSNWTVTGSGGVAVSTNHAKFGGSSAQFRGGQVVKTLVPTNMSIGTRDFTMECFALTTNGFGGGIMGRTYFSGCLYYVNPNLYYRMDGTYELSYSTALVNNAWYHFAIVKTGTTVSLFINGKRIGGMGAPATMPLHMDNAFNLGARVVSTSSTDMYSTCYIDDARWTIGAARYTNDFTPPTAPFDITISTNEGLFYFDGTTERRIQFASP